jgi:hypothetical protein
MGLGMRMVIPPVFAAEADNGVVSQHQDSLIVQ